MAKVRLVRLVLLVLICLGIATSIAYTLPGMIATYEINNCTYCQP